MKVPYTKSGKCGDTVWQRNPFGQISYAYHKPANPCTPAQVTVRDIFGEESKRWKKLEEFQRLLWHAAAKDKKTRMRLGQCGPMNGFNYFVQVNVLRRNRGLSSLDVPLEFLQGERPAVPTPYELSTFALPLVGPTLYLRTNHFLLNDSELARRFAADLPPPAGLPQSAAHRPG